MIRRSMAAPETRPVAGITTVYRKRSHADVILGKILEGFNHDGKDKPGLRLASLYVDQFPNGDMSRDLAAKHGFRLCKSIPEALTLGGEKLGVDGVLIVGEHGDYPDNEKGQKLYPRRAFFEEVAKTFRKTGKSVPVLMDKHLSATWDDAKWVYDTANELFCPMVAGSTIPLTWRRPKLMLPKGCELTAAVQLGYGPFEGYGFHALEGLQCMVERRKGGETGVAAVTALRGPAMWEAMAAGRFSQTLIEEAIRRAPAHANGDYKELSAKARDAGLMLVEYRDGLTAAVAILNGFLHEGDGGAFCFAGRLKGEEQPRSTQFYLQQPEPFGHFGYLVRAVDWMIRNGHAPYPAARTLLTTGILDAAMTRRHQGGKRIETPHLAIRYTPTDWPFADDPIPGRAQ
jgi:hypothetical protein